MPADNEPAVAPIVHHTSLKMDVPKFDGRDGPLQAQQFLLSIQTLIDGNAIPAERQKHLAISALAPKSPAWLWYYNQQAKDPAAMDSWANFKKLLTTEFCRPLSLDKMDKLSAALVLQSSEEISHLYQRVLFYLLSLYFDETPATKATDAYKRLFDLQHKQLFLKGLPKRVTSRLSNINISSSSSKEVLDAVYELVDTDPSLEVSSISSFVAPPPHSADSAHSSNFGPIIDAIRSSFGSSNRNNNSSSKSGKNKSRKGRSGGHGGASSSSSSNSGNNSYKPGSSQRASVSTLRERELAICGRCGNSVKHRTPECQMPEHRFASARRSVNEVNVDTIAPMNQGPPPFAPFGQHFNPQAHF